MSIDYTQTFAKTFSDALTGVENSATILSGENNNGALSTYKTLYDRLFGGLASVTTAQMISRFGTDASKYFKLVTDLKTFLDAQNFPVGADYETIPAYTINQDGTVTLGA